MSTLENFLKLQTKKDVALLLDISLDKLNFLIRYLNYPDSYNSFSIKKKNGKERTIYVPVFELKEIQSKISEILTELYSDRVKFNTISHGFTRSKSIKTNAKVHFGNSYLLNLDLKDFFDSIHYSRVRALFIKAFGIGYEAATTLSLLVCLNGKLPQGSPSSPIISNMICKRLDSQLYKLAKKYSLKITRYADDISISSNEVSNFYNIYFDGNVSHEIINLIESNGFFINNDKTRFSSLNQRKEVTGLIINKKINVKRKYIRNLRAQLYNVSLYDLEQRQKYRKSIRGKINYLAQIKGYEDLIFIKYALKYNDLYNESKFIIDEEKNDINKYIENRMRILSYDELYQSKKFKFAGNGTCFVIQYKEKFYYISCFHVIEKALKDCQTFRIHINDTDYLKPEMEFDFYKCSKIMDDLVKYESQDLLIIPILNNVSKFFTLESSESLNLVKDVKVIINGYPNFDFTLQENFTKIRTDITSENIVTFNTNAKINIVGVKANIPHGMSGGPVLNEKLRVVGIASNGVKYNEDERNSSRYKPGFISSKYLIEILERIDNQT